MGIHQANNPKVVGSNPTLATIFALGIAFLRTVSRRRFSFAAVLLLGDPQNHGYCRLPIVDITEWN